MTEAVVALVVLFLVMAGGRWLLLRRRPERSHTAVPFTDGVLVMRPQRRIGIMLGIGALLPAVVLVAFAARALTDGREGHAGVVASAMVALAALAVSAHQFATAFRSRVVVRDTGIERVGVLTRRSVGWGAIARVGYNAQQRWFFLTLSDGSHLWISEGLAGIGEFAAMALRRIPEAALRADPVGREALEDVAEEARESAEAPASRP
jgi:PH (Pleckstrin Homology) domain-containing protein